MGGSNICGCAQACRGGNDGSRHTVSTLLDLYGSGMSLFRISEFHKFRGRSGFYCKVSYLGTDFVSAYFAGDDYSCSDNDLYDFVYQFFRIIDRGQTTVKRMVKRGEKQLKTPYWAMCA